MQQLVRAGVLKGVRGPRGGYLLARERRRITIGEIVEVVHAIESSSDLNLYESSSDLGNKVVKPLLEDLNKDIMKRLNGVTIQDLCDRASSEGVRSEGRKNLDFII